MYNQGWGVEERSPRMLDVLRHDGHTLGMDEAHVGVLEEGYEVKLESLLEYQDILSL